MSTLKNPEKQNYWPENVWGEDEREKIMGKMTEILMDISVCRGFPSRTTRAKLENDITLTSPSLLRSKMAKDSQKETSNNLWV